MALKVAHFMTQNVVTVEAGSSLKDAVELMNTHGIGCLIILKKGRPIGIMTERDLLKRVLVNSEEIKEIRVDEIMSAPIITTQSGENAEDAAQTMLEKKIKKLPVTEDGKLVGVVTLTDLFRFEPELIKSYKVLMHARVEALRR